MVILTKGFLGGVGRVGEDREAVVWWNMSMEDLHKSEDQYYPNDQCMMLKNHALVEDPVKVQDRPINFNVTEYMIPMLQLTFGKLPLIESWCRIKEDYPHLPGKSII